jgi:hypothetical protein
LDAYKTNSYSSYAVVYNGDAYNDHREMAIHEFGHSFGNLCDEYSYGSEGYVYTLCVNCRSACSDWAGIETGCQLGCDARSDYFRPEDSVMLSHFDFENYNQASIYATYSPDGLKKRLLYFLGAEPPFGEFSTPDDGAAVSGSIAVTGWALDDMEVESVKIYSGQTYIGVATFVEGARPDIEAEFPGYPFNSRAGWGYMLLTNFLPGGGNGVYTLRAVAADWEGNRVTLGSKTITVDNANAVKPFGAIDTPTQGGTASGSNFQNNGWALTPMPNKIPEDGSTIRLYINGVLLSNAAVYNQYRPDIAGYFPGYANSSGAAVTFSIDTTAYTDGVHTIFWIAEDNAGNADGIGSRYFTVRNSARGREHFILPSDILAKIPPDDSAPVKIRKGYHHHADAEPQTIYPDDNGIIHIEINELERLEVHLSDLKVSSFYSGYHVVGEQLKPLPIGSTLDRRRGIFYWQPGQGFYGGYAFVFIKEEGNNKEKIQVRITISLKPEN